MKLVELEKFHLFQNCGLLALSCRLVRTYTNSYFPTGFYFLVADTQNAVLQRLCWRSEVTSRPSCSLCPCFSYTLKAVNCQSQKQNWWGVEICTLCSCPTAVTLPPRWTEDIYSHGKLHLSFLNNSHFHPFPFFYFSMQKAAGESPLVFTVRLNG